MLNFNKSSDSIAGNSAYERNKISKEEKDKYEKVAKDFESVLMNEMLQIMFRNENEDDSPDKSIYKSMLVNEYSKLIAPQLKLSDHILDSISKIKNGDGVIDE